MKMLTKRRWKVFFWNDQYGYQLAGKGKRSSMAFKPELKKPKDKGKGSKKKQKESSRRKMEGAE